MSTRRYNTHTSEWKVHVYCQAGSQSVADPEDSTPSCPEQTGPENGSDLILIFLEDISPFGGILISLPKVTF